MSTKSEREGLPHQPSIDTSCEDPHFGVDSRFMFERGGKDSPNSGHEFNPYLEGGYDYSSFPETPEPRVTNPQDTEALREAPGESSSPKKA